MATVNFYDTPLSEVSCSKKYKKGLSVETVVNEYLEAKNEDSETYEVYNIETGETTYESVVIDSYKVAVIVNGEEKDLTYKIRSKDVVSVIFVPESNATAGDWAAMIGSAFMLLVGIVLTVASCGSFAEFGVPLIIGGAAGLLAGTFTMLTRKDDNSKQKTDKLETEAALVINGAENQVIGDNNFPYVFGTIAENPPIVGSPYHETFTDANGKFNSQYMSALYCFGYGPQRLTDFKIGNVILNYNRPRDVDGERDNITVSHGFIDSHSPATTYEQSVADSRGYYTYNKSKRAYIQCETQPTEETFVTGKYFKLNSVIPPKWKNNDITMEILQRGLSDVKDVSVEELNGTIYNKTVIEDEVKANLIYIHDEDLAEAAEKQYKGIAIPEGYRTNTIILSQPCPSHLEVELDFSASIYRTRSEKHGDTSEQRYYDIPIRYAVQWRPIKNDNPPSDAEKGEGWRSFDYLQLGDFEDGHWQRPSKYTPNDALRDMSLNLGAKFTYSESYKKALHDYAYDTYYAKYLSEAYVQTSKDAVYNRPYGGTGYYSTEEKDAIAYANASNIANKKVNEWADLNGSNMINNVNELIENDPDGKYVKATYNNGWIDQDVFCINQEKSFTTGHSPSDFDGNERLYVFSKDFTPEETQEILNSNSDRVEVRVIRITPNYIDEAGVESNVYGDFSYQDLGVWKYLRTTCFDKDAYKKAIETKTDANAKDYPLRPIKESDLGKFTYVAIRLKQDVAETGGSSLRQVRAITSSFSPVYDKKTKKWSPDPEDLVKVTEYYQKVQTEKGWEIHKLSGYDEYMEKKRDKVPYLYKQDAGNNYVQLIADEMFAEANVIEEKPIKKYVLTESLQAKYNNTNTASSVMLSLLGPQNGDLSKTYDDVNMTSATKLFEFCEDVTDGTPDEKSEDGLLHMKFSCNGIISNPTKPEDLIKQQLITGRSILKRDDENRYEFFIGKEQKYVMNVLNSKNVISETNSRTFEDVPSGFQTTFPDEADDYTQNPLYCMDKGEDWRNPSKPMESISISYVTNREQLWSLMCFNLAGRLLQRETYTRTVGKMGLALSIGDVMLLQGDSLIVGTDKGGRIVEVIENEGKIYGFVSDEPFNYTGETDTGLPTGRSVQGVTIVQPNKYGTSRVVTLRLASPEGNGYITAENMTIGLTNIVALEKPITVSEDGNYSEESVTEDGEFVTLDPKEGDLLSFGLLTKITEKAQIVSIKPSSGKYSLSLVPYDDSYYQYGKKLPEFEPKMTIQREDDSNFEFTPYAKKADIVESKVTGDANKKELSTDVNVQTTVTSCFATRDGIQVICDVRHNGAPVKPMSIVWRFYREDIVKFYILPEAQPTEGNFADKDYYALIGGQYIKQDAYDSSIIYYVYAPKVVDTLLFEDETIEQSYIHIFDRSKTPASCNGYPEYYDLYPMKVTATAKLTVTSKTSESLYSRIDLTSYGTWVPNKPVISATVQDRSVMLSFDQSGTSRVLYGKESIVYKVQIRKISGGITEDYALPNIKTNPYPEYEGIDGELSKSNESSYKVLKLADPQPYSQEEINTGKYYEFIKYESNDQELIPVMDYKVATKYKEYVKYYVADNNEENASRNYTQTLPLTGQGISQSEPTIYEYRVRAYSTNGLYSDYETVQVRALVTNIRDIVNANLTAKEQYVDKLSAISADLGEIGDGRLGQSSTNYWTLSTRNNPQENIEEHNRDFEGAFRLGDENEYFICEPQVEGNIIKGYKIKFKVGNFEVAANRTDLNNIIYLFDDNDFTDHGNGGEKYHTKRLKLYQRGMVMEVNTGTTENSIWKSVGKVTIDELNNLFITNSDESDTTLPRPGIRINNASIYHFNEDLLDENKGNGGNVEFEGLLGPDNSPVLSDDSIFIGKAHKEMNKAYYMSFFVKDGKVIIGNDFISENAGNAKDFNGLDRSSWSNVNLPSNLFKIKGE